MHLQTHNEEKEVFSYQSIYFRNRCKVSFLLDVLSMSRSLVWCDQKRTIILETSDRVTHQLATHAFAIFVRDVLGYEDVAILRESLNSFNKTTVLERLAGLETEIEDFHEDIEE